MQFWSRAMSSVFSEIILILDLWLRKKCILKIILILVQWSGTILCNSGRGHYVEHLCEIVLNMDQCFGSMSLKEMACKTGYKIIVQGPELQCLLKVKEDLS